MLSRVSGGNDRTMRDPSFTPTRTADSHPAAPHTHTHQHTHTYTHRERAAAKAAERRDTGTEGEQTTKKKQKYEPLRKGGRH